LTSVSDMATDSAAARPAPLEQRCVWPGCTRRRAPGRTSGSGRQKEYCLLADSPADGSGPVHNARNRWAALRGADQRAVPGDGVAGEGQAEGEMGGEEAAGTVPEQFVLSIAKKRASVLLEQARRQHAAAVESLRAERELYQRLGEQLTVLTDPASLDLEIAAIASRAGRDVAQSAEEAARARRAQLSAERERDDAVLLRAHADGAAEQLSADAEAAEHALAERTAEFERDRAALLARARAAERSASAATTESVAAKAAAATAVAAAERSVSAAREHAEKEITATRATAARDLAQAREQATEQIAAALARADELAAQARHDAAQAVTEARRETAAARADAERERGATQQAREDAAAARQELKRELDAAQHRIAAAQTETAAANAHAGAAAAQERRLQAEIERLRDESGRRDREHLAELARLDAAQRTALDALRGHGSSGRTG
jgi:hypothetical protein